MLFLLGFLSALALVFITVEPYRIRILWPVALLSFTMTLVVDATGVYFNLYRFDYAMIEIAGVPLFYLLSNSVFSIIFISFFPHKRNLNIPYILAVTATFNGIEDIFKQFSYFTLLKLSYLLDWALDLIVISALVYLSFYLFHHRLKSFT